MHEHSQKSGGLDPLCSEDDYSANFDRAQLCKKDNFINNPARRTIEVVGCKKFITNSIINCLLNNEGR